jgi:HlyD family secretion protein
MKSIRLQKEMLLLLLAAEGSSIGCNQATVLATDMEIPTATVKEVNLQLKVFTTGDLRSVQSRVITAPPIGGGTLQIITLARSGSPVHAGNVVVEFDPSQQEYNLGQNRSDLAQAEQEIVKAKADADVQTAEDQTALLKAKYAVRRAELEVSKNELLSSIDAQKNLLALNEAKRALAQLQQDVQSHSASNQAALAISMEKRHKAQLAMDQARLNIKNMHVTSTIDGLIVIRGNTDSTGGNFWQGMMLPDYHVGDQANPGSTIAEVVDISHLEVSARVGETDRTNVKVGQTAEVSVEAVPSEQFSGRVQNVAGAATHEFWEDNTSRKFDIGIQLDRADARLRPGFAVRVNILGDNLSKAVSIPSEAVFDHAGKKVVYCQRGRGFETQEVKVRALSEGRAVLEGVSPGTVVALVNPEKKRTAEDKSSGPPNPSLGPGSI